MENAMDPAHTAFLHTIVSGSQFTNEFGVHAGAGVRRNPGRHDLYRDPAGGNNVWARMVEAVLPNLQQVAPIWEDGHAEHSFSGPMMSRWIVPLDDTNTMFIEYRHVSETDGRHAGVVGRPHIMLPGQLAADTYEAGQRHPGDYEAQVSQRPIAIHGMEHFGATDRGVRLFRNQMRRGIRAVRAGRDPAGLCRDAGAVVPTYCNDTIVRLPPDEDSATDRERMRDTGRRLADGYLKEPPLLASDMSSVTSRSATA